MPLTPLLEQCLVKENCYQLSFPTLPEAEVINNNSRNPGVNYNRYVEVGFGIARETFLYGERIL